MCQNQQKLFSRKIRQPEKRIWLCFANTASSDTSENNLVLRVRLEGDSEVPVSGVEGGFFDFGFSKVAGKAILQLFYAIIYIIRLTLSEHLNSSIGEVADKAG